LRPHPNPPLDKRREIRRDNKAKKELGEGFSEVVSGSIWFIIKGDEAFGINANGLII